MYDIIKPTLSITNTEILAVFLVGKQFPLIFPLHIVERHTGKFLPLNSKLGNLIFEMNTKIEKIYYN